MVWGSGLWDADGGDDLVLWEVCGGEGVVDLCCEKLNLDIERKGGFDKNCRKVSIKNV